MINWNLNAPHFLWWEIYKSLISTMAIHIFLWLHRQCMLVLFIIIKTTFPINPASWVFLCTIRSKPPPNKSLGNTCTALTLQKETHGQQFVPLEISRARENLVARVQTVLHHRSSDLWGMGSSWKLPPVPPAPPLTGASYYLTTLCREREREWNEGTW